MGIDSAYCKLFFARNGGQFTDTGLPIFRRGVKALCPRPFDCQTCQIMQSWLSGLPSSGWSPSWECVECLKKSQSLPADEGRLVQGFFQSARPGPGQGDPFDVDEDSPPLSGCPLCGFPTSFLQLVLRIAR
jgi:hypothetical protein